MGLEDQSSLTALTNLLMLEQNLLIPAVILIKDSLNSQ